MVRPPPPTARASREVSTVAGITQFPQYRNLFHFVRRPLKPRLLNSLVTRRTRRAGFGVLSKRGSLDVILDLLASGAIIVNVFDQHASKGDGIIVDFCGHPAGTFKSVALLALTTGAPVLPACSWREPDGNHVLRFEDELPLHRRWKVPGASNPPNAAGFFAALYG